MLNDQAQANRRREVRRLEFFRLDQIIFLVTHRPAPIEPVPDMDLRTWVAKLSSDVSQREEFSKMRARDFVAGLCDDEHLPAKQLNDWTRNLTGQLRERGWNLVDPQPRSYSFPPVSSDEVAGIPSAYQQELFPNDAFSIIACNVEEIDPTGSGAKSSNPAADDEDEGDRAKGNRKRVVIKQHLRDLISNLDEIGSRKDLSFAGLTVQAVTPNWIASSGKSDTGGTGGPGGEPVPYTDTVRSKRIRYYFSGLVSKLKNEEKDPKRTNLYGEGENVDVVILDTAPSGDDLVFAYKELVLLKRPAEKHPLLKSLLETDSLLKLYHATLEERRRMGNISLNRHGYKMTDHGLFIAGIINSIVPKATIHLIEVLNQFGAGDIETISRGLAKAFGIYRREQRKLVVNCSLCLDVPDLLKDFAYRESPDESIEPVEKEFEEELRKQMEDEMDQLKQENPTADPKRLQEALRWLMHLRVMCERLGRVGCQIVAAAGNDSEKKADGKRHAQSARYPAAYIKVIGVGALPKGDLTGTRHEASSFSNLADKPEQNGIMTLGGESGARKGVLGLYLGEFPEVSQETGPTTPPDDDDLLAQDEPMVQAEADPANAQLGWTQSPSNNKNGWAWWSGTSFATPILTATIASVLSAPSPSRTTQDALGRLYSEGVIQNKLTKEEEDGVPSSVKQDVNPLLQTL
jgi:hypothetical protein